jgi:hypothetical protein
VPCGASFPATAEAECAAKRSSSPLGQCNTSGNVSACRAPACAPSLAVGSSPNARPWSRRSLRAVSLVGARTYDRASHLPAHRHPPLRCARALRRVRRRVAHRWRRRRRAKCACPVPSGCSAHVPPPGLPCPVGTKSSSSVRVTGRVVRRGRGSGVSLQPAGSAVQR